MLKVMYDNIQVAHREGDFGNFRMVLEENIDIFYIPLDMFSRGRKEIPLIEVVDWLDDRVFPSERMDAEKLLKQLELKEYNVYKIAEITRASMLEDGWWIAFHEGDNYREHSIRGKSGYPEWVSPTDPTIKIK